MFERIFLYNCICSKDFCFPMGTQYKQKTSLHCAGLLAFLAVVSSIKLAGP